MMTARDNALVRAVDRLDPGTRNIAFIASILAVGWLFYGKQGNAQVFLPMPQEALSPTYRPQR